MFNAAKNENKITKTRHINGFYRIGAPIPARLVLYLLSWSGFLVSFMMRNDINFAIVAMIGNQTSSSSNSSTNFTQQFEVERNATTEDVFDWSPGIKSVIISSFYWWYVLSQVVGGIATHYYGTKHVFGWSQFATALCSLLIPTAADIHYSAVILLRSIQGFASGLTWPAMYALVGFWIPSSERSRFMSSFQGFSIGIGLTYPLCGLLIYYLGWRSVFYTTGSLGLTWCFIWYFYAFNTPAGHPRISTKELDYIQCNVDAQLEAISKVQVPWLSIFKSLPAWAIAITTFGRIWIHYIFIVSGPTFMERILKFKLKQNGFLSGIPFICSYLSSVVFCYAADKLVLHKWLTLTQVRKLCTALSQIVPALLIYWIGYVENNITLLLVLWFVAIIFITASYAGAMASIVDIAPNLAAPVLAFCQTIHMSASFLSPITTGAMVKNEESIEQWRKVFGLSTIITIGTYVVFQIFGTADIQPWNHAQTSVSTIEEAMPVYKTVSEETKIKVESSQKLMPNNEQKNAKNRDSY